ncbi:MAG TPA: hypothetical protein DD435_13675 [Cyanobacteria bacterium UBA8530]|nr:hypothetical protein [Cyanobacteria bacterium UBA8530]
MVAIFMVGCSPAPSTAPSLHKGLSGEYLKEFRADGISKKRITVFFKSKTPDLKGFKLRQGVQIEDDLKGINAVTVAVPAGISPEGLLAKVSKDPVVSAGELDRIVLLDNLTVDDPERGQQYNLDRVVAEKAWEVSMGEEIKIAIVDTGVDQNHPDLAGKLLPGQNILDSALYPKDDVGHGTHVAGIAAAATNNRLGIAGMAPNAKIIPVKVIDRARGSASSFARGIIWAADHGADVMNMSFGTYEPSVVLQKAVAYAIEKNVVLVSTMGNDDEERKRYPAAYPGVIAVGSIDRQDQKSSFSNYGDWITITAPGTKIYSTAPTYPTSLVSSNGYAFLSGTSMAAPLVTGIVALVRSQKKGATPAQVKEILQKSADDLGAPGFDKEFGYGCVNARRALQQLK